MSEARPQHGPYRRARDMLPAEIALMRDIRDQAQRCGELIERLRQLQIAHQVQVPAAIADQRWVSIGQTHLQEGFMALSRAVAKPTGF